MVETPYASRSFVVEGMVDPTGSSPLGVYAAMLREAAADGIHLAAEIATLLITLGKDLPAIGKDATTLARDIEKALAKYIRDPVVTVDAGRTLAGE